MLIREGNVTLQGAIGSRAHERQERTVRRRHPVRRPAWVVSAIVLGWLAPARAAAQPAAASGQPAAAEGAAASPASSTAGTSLSPGPDFGTQPTCFARSGQSYCYTVGPRGYCYFYGGRSYCYPSAPAARTPTGGPGSGAAGAPPLSPGSPVPAPPGGPAPAGQPWGQPGAAAGQPGANAPGTAPPAASEPAGWVKGETTELGARTLGGHTFPYPRYLDSAFVATTFHVGAGVEFYSQSEVESGFQASAGEAQSFSYDRDLVFARLRAGFDLAPWDVFAVSFEAEYLAQVGVSEQSLFLFGADTGYDLEPGVKARLWRSQSGATQLGLHVLGDFSGGLQAVPQGLLRELAVELAAIAQDQGRINCLVAADFECAFKEVDLITAIQLHRKHYGAEALLNLAHAFSPLFGGQFTLGLGGAYSNYSWRYLGDIDTGTFVLDAGLGPTFDFYPDFPLGLTLEYRFTLEHNVYSATAGPEGQPTIEEATSDTAIGNRLAAGVYFTGRRDLMLGAIVGLSFVDESAEIGKTAADQPKATIVAIQFDMRYFF
jgi:hypothetical protein